MTTQYPSGFHAHMHRTTRSTTQPAAHPRTARDRRERGQSLVEFTLVLPVFMALVMGVLEFAVAMNATLGVNHASQGAAHVAAIAGNTPGADCLILAEVERSVTTPADPARITAVEVSRTSLAGNVVYQSSRFTRGGSLTCTLADGTRLTVPYTQTTAGYPVSERCNVLAGCPTLGRTTVDSIGVSVGYRYDWITPLGAILPLIDQHAAPDAPRGWDFDRRNVFRMEPVL